MLSNSQLVHPIPSHPLEHIKQLRGYGVTLRADYCGVPPLLHSEAIISDTSTRTNLLNNYFSSVFVKEDPNSVPLMESLPIPEMDLISITHKGLQLFYKSWK